MAYSDPSGLKNAVTGYAVGRQPNGVFDPFAFEVAVDLGIGEACVRQELKARDFAAIARQDRLQNALPAIGAVNVAGPQGAALQTAELVEHEQRVIAGAFVMARRCAISCNFIPAKSTPRIGRMAQ